VREDSEVTSSDPFLAGKVPTWMAISQQVAVGNRRRTLKNGPDVMSSSEEDDEKMKPDELTDMYTSEMDPKAGPVKLTQSQVAAQKAAAVAMKNAKVPPRSQSPMPGSSDDDDPFGSKTVWSYSRQSFRPNKNWIDPGTLVPHRLYYYYYKGKTIGILCEA
jgi:hypothetical protein